MTGKASLHAFSQSGKKADSRSDGSAGSPLRATEISKQSGVGEVARIPANLHAFSQSGKKTDSRPDGSAGSLLRATAVAMQVHQQL